jgi:hypothetical protein
MYEHPIKRAGLSLNRIIYSNSKMVFQGFPKADAQKYNLGFKYRTFENGKVVSLKCKLTQVSNMCKIGYTSKDLDEVLPPRK